MVSWMSFTKDVNSKSQIGMMSGIVPVLVILVIVKDSVGMFFVKNETFESKAQYCLN